MHITLKFLGEISEKKKEDVARLLQQVTKNHQSFPLNFRGTGTFPHGSRNPRVLWIGIDKSGPLEALQAETEAKLKDLGFPVENRTFRPHLTLGRVKKRFHLEPLLSKLKRYQDEFFGEMTVQKITFFRSTLKPSGAEYTRLAEFTLE
jgi:2'-5' RNA ligase